MVSMDSTDSWFKTLVFNVEDSGSNLSLPNSVVGVKEGFSPSEGMGYRYSLWGNKSIFF